MELVKPSVVRDPNRNVIELRVRDQNVIEAVFSICQGRAARATKPQ
jgi:hypothetical protein